MGGGSARYGPCASTEWLGEEGTVRVLGVTLLRCPDSSAAGWRRRSASHILPPAPTVSPCALQETYKLPHRLIEKKRRDRINECIAQLKDLLPEHLKLTVSEKLAPLQTSSSAQRAGEGHPPPAGSARNCRPDGWILASGWLCLGGTLLQSKNFLATSCK